MYELGVPHGLSKHFPHLTETQSGSQLIENEFWMRVSGGTGIMEALRQMVPAELMHILISRYIK
jgi:hypothetical protein